MPTISITLCLDLSLQVLPDWAIQNRSAKARYARPWILHLQYSHLFHSLRLLLSNSRNNSQLCSPQTGTICSYDEAPVKVDLETQVNPPVSLEKWLDDNEAQIDSSNGLDLFKDSGCLAYVCLRVENYVAFWRWIARSITTIRLHISYATYLMGESFNVSSL